MPERVIAYVDGFNLYFGLCEAGFRRFLWLEDSNWPSRQSGLSNT